MTLGITGAFRWAGTIVSPPKHGHTCAVALDVEVNCHSLADAFASGWRRGYSSPSSLVTLAPAGGRRSCPPGLLVVAASCFRRFLREMDLFFEGSSYVGNGIEYRGMAAIFKEDFAVFKEDFAVFHLMPQGPF